MTISRHKLTDGSELIEFEREGWPKIGDVTSALILPDGRILVQQLIKLLPLMDENIVEDIEELSVDELNKKYKLLTGENFWEILKEGVEEGRYPPSEEGPEKQRRDYPNLALKHIEKISKQSEPERKVECLENIIEKCREEIEKTGIDEK